VKLVCIDPITDFAGKVNTWQDAEVRNALLKPLKRIARRYELAVVIILHLNKKEDLSVRGRAQGTVAFINGPRSAVLVGADPNQPGRGVMAQEKKNLTPAKLALGFRVRERYGAARIQWEAEWAEVTSDELLQAQKAESKLEKAKSLIQEKLADGPQLSNRMLKEGKKEGFSRTTMMTAKSKLEVKSTEAPNKHPPEWWWSLPSKAPRRDQNEGVRVQSGPRGEKLYPDPRNPYRMGISMWLLENKKCILTLRMQFFSLSEEIAS
jgi:AAA domain